MEFVRLGKGSRAPILLQRVGRNKDASLAVQATITRTASGSARRSDGSGPGGGPCPPFSEDLAAGPACGKPHAETIQLQLSYDRGLLGPRPLGLGVFLDIDCGADRLGAGTERLVFGWPVPAPLHGAAVAPGAIFGRRKVLVVTMTSGQRKEGPRAASSGPLSGTTMSTRVRTTVRKLDGSGASANALDTSGLTCAPRSSPPSSHPPSLRGRTITTAASERQGAEGALAGRSAAGGARSAAS